ncbi:MAG: hypothetical protein ABEJ05_02970, partial [Haloglomus sp.]
MYGDADARNSSEALALSHGDGNGDDRTVSEALALSTTRESLCSSGSLSSPCGACFLRAGSRALALRVRQESAVPRAR